MVAIGPADVRRVEGMAWKFARAHKLNPVQFEHADLVGFGCVGLMDAARRYDPTRGATFVTFSELRISGAMADGVRATGPMRRSDLRAVKKGASYRFDSLDERPTLLAHMTSGQETEAAVHDG